MKVLGAKTLADIESALAGVLSGAVNILRYSPQIALSVVQTAGVLGGAGAGFMTTGTLPMPAPIAINQPPRSYGQANYQAPDGQESDPGVDPALVAADAIADQISRMHELVHGDLLQMLTQSEDLELMNCSVRLRECKEILGDHKSQRVIEAKLMLDQAHGIVQSILDSRSHAASTDGTSKKWEMRVETWKKDAEIAHHRALKLKAFASAQAGRGFGDLLDIPRKAGPDSGSEDLNSFRKVYQQKLLIMREAMHGAQVSLEKTTKQYQAKQSRIVELVKSIDRLHAEEATLVDIKEFLQKTIDCISNLRHEMETLSLFFNFMSHAISQLGHIQGTRFLEAVEDGIYDDKIGFGLSYGDAHAHIIRSAIIRAQAYFSLVVESAQMYQNISADYILPCMNDATKLPLSASRELQNQASEELMQLTKDSANAIEKLAREEFEKMRSQLTVRCQEVQNELENLQPQAVHDYVRQAIEEGVRESSEQMINELGEENNCEIGSIGSE
jgi:hypothetical protein